MRTTRASSALRVRRMVTRALCGVGALAASIAPAPPAAAEVLLVERLGGADRYATAAAISSRFPPQVEVAFLVTGENFPDALAAGPIAVAFGGPVLLTRRDALPDVVHAELTRLAPLRIVVVGSPAVVSHDVEVQARTYARTGRVDRIAGSDRYATAAALADRFVSSGVPVSVASGLGFADAVAASPAAGHRRGPLLLVDPHFIPHATAVQLDELDPEFIQIAGAHSAISVDVEVQLRAYGPVTRAAGQDRFGTSVDISRHTYEGPKPTVYLATGANFPDALAGGALAGAGTGAPILLSRPDCVPQVVLDEIDRLESERVVLLGDEAVLGPNVAALVGCPVEGDGPPSTG